MKFVFANTGREKEETLLYVHNITKYWGIPITWVEAVVHKGRKGCTRKVVIYDTACRDGSVFEEVIKKYGIPNSVFLHCTRELKTNPTRSYIRSIGWGNYKNYLTAIGFRADEQGRIKPEKAAKEKQIYPLNDWGIKKPDVAVFAKKQLFDLNLADYDGNCKKCYKKELREIAAEGFELAADQSLNTEKANYFTYHDLDEVEYGGCAESCEPF